MVEDGRPIAGNWHGAYLLGLQVCQPDTAGVPMGTVPQTVCRPSWERWRLLFFLSARRRTALVRYNALAFGYRKTQFRGIGTIRALWNGASMNAARIGANSRPHAAGAKREETAGNEP